jgi:TolB-like protein/Flp pilus assembly protein TadD/predicted Ser/Thr protein kinase
MTNASRVCAECGATVFADAPQGVCSACLFRTGLASLENENGEAFEPTVARMLKDFGDYELLEEIGRGGQGVVYRARQKSLNRIVALKVIGLAHWATEAHVKRFRLEAEAAASLNHPCIVPIYEVGERDGACYFSMGLVDGGQLDAVAKREPMPVRHAAELIAKLARTVHYAHEHGILHRDIKPGNILLDTKGEPHLTDFGLARLVETESTVTRTMEVLGTPSYMAPEQAVGNNARVAGATDIYGLGAVLYQLLTGHPPFAGGTTFETVRLVLDTDPRQPRLWNPKVDRDLATICLKCLEKDPQRRYSSALALAEDLERWLKHEPIRARRTGIFTRGRKWVRRNPTSAVLVVALAAAIGAIIWKTEFVHRPSTTGIAVLPFENLGDDKENAFFADGMQDELLSTLAKIADLKVISRTSVMQYKSGIKRNLKEIAQQLGVDHVVEGNVRRADSRVRVSVQLIDARTDTHLWAEHYDRDVADIFAIQSEIAASIAEQLRAHLSAREKAAIATAPTRDLVANDLYVRAKELEAAAEADSGGRDSLLKAVHLLEEAVARDPGFVLAYCLLCRVHLDIYWLGFDHTDARREFANAALRNATRLQPDAGEVHFARATYAYHGFRDYAGARTDLDLARSTLPNDAELYWYTASIDRRQGRWGGAIRNFERAIELDPRNYSIIVEAALTHLGVRRFAESRQLLERALSVSPGDRFVRTELARSDFSERGELDSWRSQLSAIVAERPADAAHVALHLVWCALAARDREAAARALTFIPPEGIIDWRGNVLLPREWLVGLVAWSFGDKAGAQTAFTAARPILERITVDQPEYAPAWSLLGMIDAALGRKENAIREGRHACELLPVSKDSWEGPYWITNLATIYAWTGDNDAALQQLGNSASSFGFGVTYGELKLFPIWDSLRSDPRFDQIVASLAPKL